MKRALVTGGTGFIGSALCRALADRGVETICLGRRKGELDGVSYRVPDAWSAEGLLEAAPGTFDVIYHLAASGTSIDERGLDDLIAGHIRLTTSVLKAATEWSPKHVIMAGSWSELPSLHSGLDGDARAISLYGAAKASATLMAQALAQTEQLSLVTLRLFNVYGPGEAAHRLIPFIYRCAQEDTVPDLTAGDQRRDFVYLDDVVDAMIKAHAIEPRPGHPQVFEICSGESVAVRRLVEEAARLLDAPAVLDGLGRRPSRPDEPPVIAGSAAAFRAATGWEPQTSWQDGVQKTIENLATT